MPRHSDLHIGASRVKEAKTIVHDTCEFCVTIAAMSWPVLVFALALAVPARGPSVFAYLTSPPELGQSITSQKTFADPLEKEQPDDTSISGD